MYGCDAAVPAPAAAAATLAMAEMKTAFDRRLSEVFAARSVNAASRLQARWVDEIEE